MLPVNVTAVPAAIPAKNVLELDALIEVVVGMFGPPMYIPNAGVPVVIPCRLRLDVPKLPGITCANVLLIVLPVIACPIETVPVTVPPTVNDVELTLDDVDVNEFDPVTYN